MFEGLRVVSAGYEGSHHLQRLPQYPVVRVILRCVLTQVLGDMERKITKGISRK